jgi:hypothetical protein
VVAAAVEQEPVLIAAPSSRAWKANYRTRHSKGLIWFRNRGASWSSWRRRASGSEGIVEKKARPS